MRVLGAFFFFLKPTKIDEAFARGYAAGFPDGKRFALQQTLSSSAGRLMKS